MSVTMVPSGRGNSADIAQLDARFATCPLARHLRAAAGDSTQLYGAFEWRLGKHIAVVGALRVLTSQTLTTTVDETHRLDPYTTLHVAARAGGDVSDAEAFKGAAALSGALHGSWGGWNGRAGLSVGNVILPAVNVVLPVKFPMPDFDLYYRF